MKRHVSILKLVGALITDASKLQPTTVPTAKDMETIQDRIMHEGLSFLTITLPNFSTDIFTALEQGGVTSNLFSGWKKRSCLPAFLQGFTKLVFDTKTGVLKNDASIEAIAAIRQICLFFKKVKMECTPERIERALRKYISTDETLDSVFCHLKKSELEVYAEFAHLLVGSLFSNFDPRNLKVHHGPGSTADFRKGNKKFVGDRINFYRPLATYFPVGDGIYWPNEYCYHLDEDDVTYSDVKVPVHVTCVPKTLKTPRVIAMEPTSMLLIQQGIKDYLVDALERHPLTRGHVNFSDQTINQSLALKASRTMSLATLDLSEASDRVHNEFIKLMFDSNPVLSECLQLCRSEMAKVLDRTIHLNKFASMGSALCFPLEALFFYTVLLIAKYKQLCKKENTTSIPITLGLIKALSRDIYVYGDDLIIPTDMVEIAVETLAQYGNVVGLNKSFFRSYFRESCGMDAYKGVNITPIYLRELPPNGKLCPSAIVSNVATTNLLYNKGYWETAAILQKMVERRVGPLPTFASLEHDGLGWDFGENRVKPRFNPELHRLEVQTIVPTPIKRFDRISGYPALTKCLRSMEQRVWHKQPYRNAIPINREHLVETEVRYALKLKRSRVPLNL